MRIILLLLALQTLFSSVAFAQSLSKKDTLYIESVDFDIQTFTQISCDSFENNFKGRVKVRFVDNRDTLSVLDHFLDKRKFETKNRGIDVRAKFIYQMENTPAITICTNGYEVLVDGRLIKHNIKFADFLKSLTK